MQIEEGKKREQVSKYLHCHRDRKKSMGKFQSRKCQTLVLKLLVGLHRRLCVLLWDVLLARSRLDPRCSASRARGLCDAEPEFRGPMVRVGAWPRRPAGTAPNDQVREEVAVLAKAPGEMQNCSCAWGTWCFLFCLARLCQHKARLYWDSWASADTSIPQWRGASEETLQSCTSTAEVLQDSVGLLWL